MPEKTTYTGSCHCGSVRFEVDAAIEIIASCNCSFCSKSGALWNMVPISDFRHLTNEDALSDYQFHRHIIHHVFCKDCGIHAFSRGTDANGNAVVAVNVRCLDSCDLTSIPVKHIDGKKF